MPDFEETESTWIIAGTEKIISFNFTIPDDLGENDYKGYYELSNGSGDGSGEGSEERERGELDGEQDKGAGDGKDEGL